MGTLSAPQEAFDPPGDCLRPDEFMAALADLSAAEKLKLAKIEAIYRKGTSYRSGDLLREVGMRVALDKRHCPRNIAIMAFMIKAMKSISYHEKQRLWRERALFADAAPAETGLGETTFSPALEMEAGRHTERDAHSAEAMEEIYKLFEKDREAQQVIAGLALGLRGAELRDEAGLDQAALDYAKKRIRKKIGALYPERNVE
jgi:hypothetical protein